MCERERLGEGHLKCVVREGFSGKLPFELKCPCQEKAIHPENLGWSHSGKRTSNLQGHKVRMRLAYLRNRKKASMVGGR